MAGSGPREPLPPVGPDPSRPDARRAAPYRPDPGGADADGLADAALADAGAPRAVRRPWLWLPLAAVLLVASVLLACGVGTVHLSPGAIGVELLDRLPFVHLHSGLDTMEQNLLLQVRLPRVLCATLVGALLASGGAGYQGVFRNPLADPYLLGAAAGAGLGATLVIVNAHGGAAAAPPAAFVGALTGVALSYLLGRGSGSMSGAAGTAALILSGVAVSAFLQAVQTFLMQRHTQELQQVYGWLLGDIGAGGWSDLRLAAPYAAVGTVGLLICSRRLDVLAVGDEEALSLGVRPGAVRLAVIACASLSTAAAVAVSGLIGFVGIVVPHLVRLVAGPSYRLLVPLSLLVGGAFLTLADLVGRTVVAPDQLPIGVVTAFAGAPFFLLILRLRRSGAAL